LSGLGLRKAYYLLSIDQQLSRINISPAQLRRIGWTKLQIIAKRITRKNMRQLIAMAEQNTSYQLTKVIRGIKAKRKKRCILMYFTEAQYRKFEAAVLRNGGIRRGRGLINKEQAILRALKA
jgi:hypothetical protein